MKILSTYNLLYKLYLNVVKNKQYNQHFYTEYYIKVMNANFNLWIPLENKFNTFIDFKTTSLWILGKETIHLVWFPFWNTWGKFSIVLLSRLILSLLAGSYRKCDKYSHEAIVCRQLFFDHTKEMFVKHFWHALETKAKYTIHISPLTHLDKESYLKEWFWLETRKFFPSNVKKTITNLK